MAERLASVHSTVKVLYMSGYTNETLAHQGVVDPGTALLEKPFTPVTLARRVREILGCA